MKVIVLKKVVKELEFELLEARHNVFSMLSKIELGEKMQMPICRPLFKIARGLYELRLSDKAGELRVFYYVKTGDAIYVLHAMRKKTQMITMKTIGLLKKRIRSL